MATNIGPKIGIDGESEYRKSINEIIEQQKTLKSEMKLAAAEFSKDADAKKKSAKETEILTKAIENQKKRITELEKGLEASKEKYGENSVETEKWKRAVTDAETELVKLQTQLERTGQSTKGLGEQFEEVGTKMQGIGSAVEGVGTTLTKNVTTPIVGLGAAAMAAFNEVDKGSDTIIQKTGATGEALAGMEESMRNIATTIPTSFEEAGAAIGEVNTRFGLTGEALESLSTKFIQFAELNGTDVNNSIDTVQQAMNAFGLSAEDAGSFLDTLNQVGQNTGVSMDSLSSAMVTNATAFMGLGLNAADAAHLLGSLEKSGIDTSVVLTGLSKVQKTAMEDGISMEEALTQAMTDSGAAIDIFGAKAGPKLYESFQSGILTIDMFTQSTHSLDEALGSVSGTYEATLDPMDEWKTTLNEITIAGAELGNAIGPVLVPAIKGLANIVKQASEWFGGLSKEQQGAIVKVGAFVAAVGPVLTVVGKVIAVGGKLIAGIGKLKALADVLGIAVGALSGPIGIAIAAIGGLVAAGVFLYKNWDTIKGYAKSLGDGIKNTWNGIKTATSNVWDSIKNTISSKIQGAKDAVKSAIDRIKGFFNFQWSLPKLKLPHFTITGSFSLNPPRVPKFSIQWYKKAYDNAVMFTSPTVLATASGLKGFGDGSGAEIVIGSDKLMSTMTDAVRAAFGYVPPAGGNTSTTFGDTVINVYGAPGQDVEELADIIEDRINAHVRRQEEVYA